MATVSLGISFPLREGKSFFSSSQNMALFFGLTAALAPYVRQTQMLQIRTKSEV